MRARRVHAVGVGLGLVLALSTGCSDAEPRRLDLARPSTSPPPPSDGAGPTSATTPRPPDAPAASEHERILAQYRKYFTAQTLLIRAPAAQRPALLAEVAVDPSYSRTLAGLAAADAAGETFYGEITLHPVVVSVNGRTAELRDCQDASARGRMMKDTGEKVTVGRDGDELLATMTRGDDGLWRMSQATYQSAQC